MSKSVSPCPPALLRSSVSAALTGTDSRLRPNDSSAVQPVAAAKLSLTKCCATAAEATRAEVAEGSSVPLVVTAMSAFTDSSKLTQVAGGSL